MVCQQTEKFCSESHAQGSWGATSSPDWNCTDFTKHPSLHCHACAALVLYSSRSDRALQTTSCAMQMDPKCFNADLAASCEYGATYGAEEKEFEDRNFCIDVEATIKRRE